MVNTQFVFKKKVIYLLVMIGVLGLANLLVLFLNSSVTNQRAAILSWLDERYLSYIDRIEIKGPEGNIVLNRKNNVWVITVPLPENNFAGNLPGYTVEYPVKQSRVEDLLNSLSRRGNYPVRSSAAPEILGLGQGGSSIVVYGGVGLPLLDLSVGLLDVAGREVFLQKAGQKEIRSGIDVFTIFIDSPPSFWYDLRLFPDVSPDMVQRVYLLPLNAEDEQLTIVRRNTGWIIENTGAQFSNGESWVRSIVEAQAEDFVLAEGIETSGSIILELGNGTVRALNVDLPLPSGNRIAMVSGSGFYYSLSEWTVNRIFRSEK